MNISPSSAACARRRLANRVFPQLKCPRSSFFFSFLRSVSHHHSELACAHSAFHRGQENQISPAIDIEGGRGGRYYCCVIFARSLSLSLFPSLSLVSHPINRPMARCAIIEFFARALPFRFSSSLSRAFRFFSVLFRDSETRGFNKNFRRLGAARGFIAKN